MKPTLQREPGYRRMRVGCEEGVRNELGEEAHWAPEETIQRPWGIRREAKEAHWSQQQADKPGPLEIQKWVWLEWGREVVWEALGSLGDQVRMRAAVVRANCFRFLLSKDHRQISNGAEPAPS